MWWIGGHAVLFFFLFSEFYFNAYLKRKTKKEEKKDANANNSTKSFESIIPCMLHDSVSSLIPLLLLFQPNSFHIHVVFPQNIDGYTKVANGKSNGHANGIMNGTTSNGHMNGVTKNGHANGHLNGSANGHLNNGTTTNGHLNGHANGTATTNGHLNGTTNGYALRKRKD